MPCCFVVGICYQVSDIDREVKRIPIEISRQQGVEIITHNIPSSGERYGGA